MGIAERKQREKEMQQRVRREQILNAAKRVFHTRGFSSVTVEDIAKEAELSPAALYLYFKNKDDIYVSLNLQLLEYLSGRLESLQIQKDIAPEEKIATLKDLFNDVYRFDPLILINLFHLQASDGLEKLPPERLSQLNALAGKSLRSLAAIFDQGQAEGRFETHHSTALADIVWIIFTGAVLWEESKRMINPEKDYLRSTLDIALDIFRKGITNR
ncbi:MAG: TetR/AcrR family transcriptional regulator [Thermodesulfobacteriota bacterium]|nr:TetR/AcrR family transcriptional regulator [Thermodesulfobacteriota bacterium]